MGYVTMINMAQIMRFRIIVRGGSAAIYVEERYRLVPWYGNLNQGFTLRFIIKDKFTRNQATS